MTLTPDVHVIETIDGSRTQSLVEVNVIEPFVTSVVSQAVVDKNTMFDLELFESYNGGDDTVFDALDFTATHGGEAVLRSIMTRPVHDVPVLEQRKRVLRQVDAKYAQVQGDTDALLKRVRDNMDTVAWFMTERSEEENALFNMVYFSKRILKGLNKRAGCLDALNMYRMFACPAIGIVSPILYFVIPFVIIRIKYKEPIGFVEYLKLMYAVCNNQLSSATGSTKATYVTYMFSLVFYFQSIFTTIEVSSTLQKILRIITDRCVSLTSFVEAAEALCATYSPLFSNQDFGFDDTIDAQLEGLSIGVHHPYSPAKAMIGKGVGSVLVKFKTFNFKKIVPLMLKASIIDTLVAITKARGALGLCYAEYSVDASTPSISAKGLWHVCLPIHEAVRNDVAVGGAKPNNVVITGPNAGGKSTLVKSVFVNLLLAQTLCVAAAEDFVITPFHIVSTQMNVPDCKGKESLFEAEMNRCKEKLDIANQAGGQFIALAFDEIFSSTEPTEGVAGAFAIARSLARHENVVTFITTHFKYLCKLADEEDFEAWKMSASVDSDGEITFAFKLEPGVSEQHIALELLREKGFDKDVIEDAIAIRGSLKGAESLVQNKI